MDFFSSLKESIGFMDTHLEANLKSPYEYCLDLFIVNKNKRTGGIWVIG